MQDFGLTDPQLLSRYPVWNSHQQMAPMARVMAAVTTFVVMPLTMLSGTFYTVQRLPEPFRSFSHYNPFFYTIAGFRYGTIGLIDGSLLVGVAITGGVTLVMGAICWWLFQTGYRLKS